MNNQKTIWEQTDKLSKQLSKYIGFNSYSLARHVRCLVLKGQLEELRNLPRRAFLFRTKNDSDIVHERIADLAQQIEEINNSA